MQSNNVKRSSNNSCLIAYDHERLW